MITIEGKNSIKATVLAYSISLAGKIMITWEIEYPRLILAELNTHRQLSRNSFSSRAVPFIKMLEQLQGEPVRFGANQAGMQDKGDDYDAGIELPALGYFHKLSPKLAWTAAKNLAIVVAKAFYQSGYHKQVYNRLLEPFQMMKTVISATEIDNFFWLRDDDAADPTIRELARVMREAMEASTPEVLEAGEWHTPYVKWKRALDGSQLFFLEREVEDGSIEPYAVTLEEAIKVSCARCAAVSYRNEGYDLAKSIEVYDRLVGSDKKHASALEHCASPCKTMAKDLTGKTNDPRYAETWEPGITHADRKGELWSGNLCGWIQHRKLVPGECYTKDI